MLHSTMAHSDAAVAQQTPERSVVGIASMSHFLPESLIIASSGNQ